MSVRHLEWATIQGGLELNLQKRNQRGEDVVFRSQLPCCSSSNYPLNSQISSVPRTVFVFVSCEERLLLCRHGRTAPFWLPLLLRTQPPYARVGIHVWKLKKISVFFPPLSFLSFLALLCHFLFFPSLCVILTNLEAGKSSSIWVIWFKELTRFFINSSPI